MAPNRLLAPYSDAMRLGMGFNSFTQELCIDDAVKLAGQWPLENNTSPPPKYGQTPVPDGGNYPTSISQDVTFSAKLVDRISQVTDSLNVSGPFQIKCDAGGGKASTFIDIDKFKESHINYLVQVLVTNQVLNAPNVTNFAPIPNLPESKFTRVYGDCFISGFTEGGEFNALISIKLKDPSNTNKIKAELQANFKATRVSGSTHLDESDSTMAIDGETTIAVSWKGGGNIRDTIPQWPPGDPNPDWTVQSVKAAAVKFPEHVMTTAIRTNAILTKYTSLKNFHEKTIKGAPLDYKNTGLYSSVLLDAYTDYKIIWRDLGHAASDVDQGQSILTAKEAIPELAELALEAKANYEAQMKEYQQKIESLKQAHSKHASSSSSSQALVLPEPPMPPNDCVPYKGNIFGLDKARLACRLEMIKIVREVDAVAEDPEIACDPSRASPYLNPAVFRMLLPTVTNLGKKVAEELAAAEAKQAAEAQMKAQEQLRTDLMTSQKKLEELEQQRRTMENLNRELEDKVRALELNLDGGWCPVAVDQPIRFRSCVSNKSMDYDYHDGMGPLKLQQYRTNHHANQKFEIQSVGPKGFCIRHIASGRYLTTGNTGDRRVYMVVGDFPTLFTFEKLLDDDGGWTGFVHVHLAHQNQYTLNVEGASQHNFAPLIGWSGDKGDCDKWYIENFD